MTDEESFLKAILEQPDDDLRKKAYADHLEERGDPRGEYLRLMLQLRSQRVLTPEQRKRREALSDALAGLRQRSTGPNRRMRILEEQLRQLENQVRQEVPARLQALAAQFDPIWLAVVSDPQVEGCLRFRFVCEQSWSDMEPTAETHVRHCQNCRKSVHFCETIDDAREHAEEGRCVAVDLGVIRRNGDLTPRRIFKGMMAGP